MDSNVRVIETMEELQEIIESMPDDVILEIVYEEENQKNEV